MKVQDVMTSDAKACAPHSSLSAAASLMWENDCGALPVIADEGRVIGMITDRDICFGTTTKDCAPSQIAVSEVITGKVFACTPEDDVREAMETMRRERVRRLPVIGADGTLHGIVSMNDIVLRAEEKARNNDAELSYADVVQTYKAICGNPLQEVPQEQKAATV